MIYADYAATSGYHSDKVINAVVNAMKNPGNAGRGSHEAALSAARTVYDARQAAAKLFGADDPSQVAFTCGITMSLNIAIKGLLKPGDHAVTTYAEHNSVLRPLYEMRKLGVELTVTAPDAESIKRALKSNTKAVIMTCASNVTGDVYDFSGAGKLCRENGIVFIADTAQYAGTYPVLMDEDNIDVLCFTGHKGIMGPQGTGGIITRKEIVLRPFVTGGSGVHSFSETHPSEMPTVLEAGTLNTPGIAGLREAIDEVDFDGNDGLKYAEKFYNGIKELPGIEFYGSYSDWSRRTPIVAFNIGNYDSSDVSRELSERFGIETRAGAHCAPLMHEHLGTRDRGIVRASFGKGNTYEETEQCIEAVRTLVME